MAISPTRNASLDTLRTIAILAVVAHHLIPGAALGARGVDLFFVLSGYLIGGILFARVLESGTFSLTGFWRDRWLRTLPAYYAALAVYVGKDLMVGADPKVFASYTVFLQSYVYSPEGLPRFHHSWSLAVEEHFYLVLPVLLLVLCRLRLQRFAMPAILIGGLILFVTRLWIVETGGELQTKLSHWRTEALIVGVSLAWLDQTRRGLRVWIANHRRVLAAVSVFAVVAAGVVDTLYDDLFQLPLALAFGLLVLLAIGNYPAFEIAGRQRVVAWIARISYSLYLVHPMILLEVAKRDLPNRLGVVPGWSVAIMLSLGLSLVAAELLHLLVERPGLWVRQRLRRRGAPHSE